MYIIGSTGDDVNEYDLSTAWDVSTASFLQLFSVAAQEGSPSDLFFRDDGLKMYVVGTAGDDVNEYDLSTAWDVSTASFAQLFSVIDNANNPSAVFFRPDGRKMYVLSPSSNDVNEYDVGIVGRRFSVAAQETTPSEVFFKPDGLKMYIIGSTGDDVNEYDLSTAWDVRTASFVQSFSVAAQETTPRGLFFRDDGLKMYVVGTSGDDVNEYDLSTAWDVSTASFLQLFSVAAQETDPSAVFFKPDGTKMYVVGISSDNVNEYDLSTAWDVSTASFLQLFSVAAQETFPRGLFFKPDGTKMYVVGTSGDDVNEYNLSTAWDVSTASFVQLFSVAAQETTPFGLFFRDDGLRMYVVGIAADTVFEYIFAA
jgi:DNA-binding beta-propeller fold protein YncE